MAKPKKKPTSKNKRTETVTKRVAKQKDKLIVELGKVPIIQVACARIGIDRSTYYRWKMEDKEFEQYVENAISEGVSLINDMAESKMISGIQNGEKTFIIFWLKNRHKVYHENHFHVKINTQKSKPLSDERMKQIADGLKNWSKRLLDAYKEKGDKKEDK